MRSSPRSAVAVRSERIRPVEKQEEGNIVRNNDAISRALAYAAELLESNEWCEGSAITLADLAMASALVYLDLRQPERDWRSAHPGIAAWFARISERPSLRTTMAD